MAGTLLNMHCYCRKCLARLTLEEMHYLDCGTGMATCSKCETEWMHAMLKWRISDQSEPMPERP